MATNPKPSFPASGRATGCDCTADPFANLPPEQRPAAKPATEQLRQVTCPGCGLNTEQTGLPMYA